METLDIVLMLPPRGFCGTYNNRLAQDGIVCEVAKADAEALAREGWSFVEIVDSDREDTMAVEPASGGLVKVFAKEQTTYDTLVAFVTGDAVSPVAGSFKMDDEVKFEKVKESVGTATLQSEVKLGQAGKWSGQFLVKPQAVGTAPEIGPALLKAALGIETITSATSAVYTLTDTVYTALQLGMIADGHWGRFASGAWVEAMKISVPGNGLPTIDFSGGYARSGWVYRDVTKNAEATGQTSIEVADASRGCVQEPAMCEFTGDDNATAGYLVTAHTHTASAAAFTISPGIAGAGLGLGVDILPFVLAQTLGGNVIGATECAVTFGSLSLGFISANFSVKTGIGPLDKEATTTRPNGLCRVSDREVEGEIEFYFKNTNAGNEALLGYALEGTTYDFDLQVGANSAAYRMLISLPKARLDTPSWNVGTDVITAKAKIVSRQSAAACDEFSLSFT